MKSLFALALILFSFTGFPSGDKGNVAGGLINLNANSLESLLNLALDTEEKLYEPLAAKSIKQVNGKVILVGTDKLSNEALLGQYVSLINELMARGEGEMLSSLIFENELFYEAFSTISLKEKIYNLKNISSDEKRALALSLDNLFKTFWQNARDIIKSKRGLEATNRFFEQINAEELGYEISMK